MLKLSENPPIAWPEDKPLREYVGKWWVAHTKSRNEKALAWQLVKKQISYFLPMTLKVAKNKGRTTRSMLPLFTGYLFFCATEEQRIEVLQTNRLANMIEVTETETFINDIEPIERLLRQGESLTPHDYIKEGQKCRVIAGPLLGTEGIVEKTPEHMRLVLQVDMLGQATSVDIEADMIELIED
jgi:transcription antitermination factor NusG